MPIQPSCTHAPEPATPATPPVSMIVATSRSEAPSTTASRKPPRTPAPAASQAIRRRAISAASLIDASPTSRPCRRRTSRPAGARRASQGRRTSPRDGSPGRARSRSGRLQGPPREGAGQQVGRPPLQRVVGLDPPAGRAGLVGDERRHQQHGLAGRRNDDRQEPRERRPERRQRDAGEVLEIGSLRVEGAVEARAAQLGLEPGDAAFGDRRRSIAAPRSMTVSGRSASSWRAQVLRSRATAGCHPTPGSRRGHVRAVGVERLRIG